MYAYTSSVSVTPSPVTPGQTATATFTTNSPSSQVTFIWYDNAGNVVFTDGPKALSSGSATSQFTLPASATGEWEVDASAGSVTKSMAFEITTFNIVPELPLIGTAGAAVAMVGGLVYIKKRKN